ncbi:DedA family protein [Rhizobium sp. DKSPLA3]|uniref:DedA family protein n=1 Tax=Rhizobium quercicola TaxID=2901226 RepID=A0A9X1NVC8_9HYPH|nr:DedA family protein [Rhizobium quercicola]MCD7111787.1 DedA family protein [Rhizobium quercicola]
MENIVESLMQMFGPWGIALLMFLEHIFPPIPSELIMPLAGYRASQGDMSIVTVIVAGSIGSLLGVMPWYYAGRKLGEARMKRLAAKHGRWLTLTEADVDAASRRFREKGATAILVGRLIPTIRTLISVPAGIARMPLSTFTVFSLIGTVAWTSGLALAGYLLGQAYDVVSTYVDPVSTGIFVLIVLFYGYRVATFKPQPSDA